MEKGFKACSSHCGQKKKPIPMTFITDGTMANFLIDLQFNIQWALYWIIGLYRRNMFMGKDRCTWTSLLKHDHNTWKGRYDDGAQIIALIGVLFDNYFTAFLCCEVIWQLNYISKKDDGCISLVYPFAVVLDCKSPQICFSIKSYRCPYLKEQLLPYSCHGVRDIESWQAEHCILIKLCLLWNRRTFMTSKFKQLHGINLKL